MDRPATYGTLGTNGFSGSSGSGGSPGSLSLGGGVYIAGGSISLYNATVALNSSGTPVGDGVFQVGGSVNVYNSLFANNGYTGSGTGPTGADYYRFRERLRRRLQQPLPEHPRRR